MDVEAIVDAVTKAVPHLLAAARLWYARVAVQPAEAKLRVCRALLRLRDSLNSIAYTGEDIGERMTTETLETDGARREFIDLLNEQNENIKSARSAFDELATIFEIHAPELNPLLFHLNQKGNRIEVLYTVASTLDVQRRLKEQTNDNSRFFDDPRELTPLCEFGERKVRIEQQGKRRGTDQHFEAIVALVPVLNRFIKDHCPPECLA